MGQNISTAAAAATTTTTTNLTILRPSDIATSSKKNSDHLWELLALQEGALGVSTCLLWHHLVHYKLLLLKYILNAVNQLFYFKLLLLCSVGTYLSGLLDDIIDFCILPPPIKNLVLCTGPCYVSRGRGWGQRQNGILPCLDLNQVE